MFPARRTIGLLVLSLIVLSFSSLIVLSEGPPHNFEVPPASFWGGTSGYYQVGMVFQDKGMVKWSFESDGPLDLEITDPEGSQIDAVYNQYSIEGTFSVNRIGTYIFTFHNKYDEVAQVSLNYFYTSPLNEGQSFGLMLIGGVLVVVLAIIFIFFVLYKKRPSSRAIPQAGLHHPTPPPYQQEARPVHPPVQQPFPQPSPRSFTRVEEVHLVVCESCGYKNLPNARFCNDCGKPMSG